MFQQFKNFTNDSKNNKKINIFELKKMKMSKWNFYCNLIWINWNVNKNFQKCCDNLKIL